MTTALVRCPTCNHAISPRAESCPSCGEKRASFPHLRSLEQIKKPHRGKRLALAITAAVAIVAAFIGYAAMNAPPRTAPAPIARDSSPAPIAPVDDWGKGYELGYKMGRLSATSGASGFAVGFKEVRKPAF